jgi:molybdopterin converting factor small subunit
MKLQLGGSLAWYDAHKRSNLQIRLEQGILLTALLQQLSIPRPEIAIISINGNMFVGDDILVNDSDTIALYPPMGGG